MQKINEQAVRALVQEWKKKLKIPLIRIGEVLGSRSSSVAGRTMFAHRYMREPGEGSFSLSQMNAMADFFGVPVTDLLLLNDTDAARPTGTRVPVLGGISAAKNQEPQSWIEYPFGAKRQQVRALTVEDDSMAPRFAPGDLVFFRQGATPKPGAVVLVTVSEGVPQMRKMFVRDGGIVDLVPENEAFMPTRLDAEQAQNMTVLGVVEGHMHQV